MFDSHGAEVQRERIVIVVASRHGSTLAIAGALAQVFVAAGMSVTVAEADDDVDLTEADAIVLGSAVYLGRWMKAARRFVDHRSRDFAGRPVWMFSSGPLGDGHESGLDPDHLDGLMMCTGAVEHREFGGRLESSELGPLEALVVKGVKAPEGDYRDWDEIRSWAHEIRRVVREAGEDSTVERAR